MELDTIVSLAINKVLSLRKKKIALGNIDIEGLLSFSRSIVDGGLSIADVFAEVSIGVINDSVFKDRSQRNNLSFKIASGRSISSLSYVVEEGRQWYIKPDNLKKCIEEANIALEKIHDLSSAYGVEIFELLGLRNLSAFVGQVMVKVYQRNHSDQVIINPNQDGYPDLCALTPKGERYIRQKGSNPDDSIRPNKELWSPYPHGGLEVKATCGNTPAASKMAKPLIGESRYPNLVSAEWKAHHQETKILLGIFWDFLDGLPTMLAAFFRNDLDVTIGRDNEDWGNIIHPIEGGGRTTSVSIMKKLGVKKMGQGWVVLPEDEKILNSLSRVFYIE